MTSFNIAATCVTELSGCDYSAEVEIQRTKGEEMTKTRGDVQPPKQITKAERDARMAFRQVDAKKAMTEQEIAQKAFSNNRERLKAERLVREAAGPPPPKTKASKAKGK